MPNDPGDRMIHGLLEAFWTFGAATVLRPCDGCGDPVAIGEKSYRPAGFFTKPGLPDVTAREIGVMETFCIDCADERRAFLAKELAIIGQVPNKETEHG